MKGNSHTGKITPSKENYLKVMLELSSEEGIRSTDIASALGISKASVSSMMNVLREAGYGYGYPAYAGADKEAPDEREFLSNQADFLEKQLQQVKKRLSRLKEDEE